MIPAVGSAADLGVPLKLETTYDILSFTAYELSSYSSVFHIMAMRAASELARAADDPSGAARYAAAAERGTASLDRLQWVNSSTWMVNAGAYCPNNFEFVRAGLSVPECQSNCTGSCQNVFLSTEGRGYFYLCRDTTIANMSGYNLYTKSGAVQGSYAAASDGCTDNVGCITQHGMFADTLYAQVQ